MISPSKLQLQALVNARAKVLFSAKMAAVQVLSHSLSLNEL